MLKILAEIYFFWKKSYLLYSTVADGRPNFHQCHILLGKSTRYIHPPTNQKKDRKKGRKEKNNPTSRNDISGIMIKIKED